MRSLALALALAGVAAIGSVSCGKKTRSELTIAAASSLTGAFDAVGKAFTARTGKKVVFSFGSSGNLAKQIQNGGPFDVFASADMGFVDQVVGSGDALADTRASYARGRVIVWSPAGPISSLADLEGSAFKKISLSQPEHAPYGLAGKQALQKTGVWPRIESRIVYGANVRDTLQHAETGNSDASITALSLLIGTDKQYFVVPEELHAPIDQGIAVISHSKHLEDARAFVAFVRSPEGQAILRTHGLLQPGDSLPDPR
jgi:molybdate transport system substrate-binding protein